MATILKNQIELQKWFIALQNNQLAELEKDEPSELVNRLIADQKKRIAESMRVLDADMIEMKAKVEEVGG